MSLFLIAWRISKPLSWISAWGFSYPIGMLTNSCQLRRAQFPRKLWFVSTSGRGLIGSISFEPLPLHSVISCIVWYSIFQDNFQKIYNIFRIFTVISFLTLSFRVIWGGLISNGFWEFWRRLLILKFILRFLKCSLDLFVEFLTRYPFEDTSKVFVKGYPVRESDTKLPNIFQHRKADSFLLLFHPSEVPIVPCGKLLWKLANFVFHAVLRGRFFRLLIIWWKIKNLMNTRNLRRCGVLAVERSGKWSRKGNLIYRDGSSGKWNPFEITTVRGVRNSLEGSKSKALDCFDP